MSGDCNLLSSVSSQQKCEAMDIKALGASQLLDSLWYSSWTDQFYLENKGKYILKAWGHFDPEDAKRRETDRETEREHVGERPPALWLLFLYVFSKPLGLPYVNWDSQECYLFNLRSSLWTFLCSIFTGFSFPCLLATAILDSFFLF